MLDFMHPTRPLGRLLGGRWQAGGMQAEGKADFRIRGLTGTPFRLSHERNLNLSCGDRRYRQGARKIKMKSESRNEKQEDGGYLWKLVLCPWLPVTELKQAKSLTLLATTLFGAIGITFLLGALYAYWFSHWIAVPPRNTDWNPFPVFAAGFLGCVALGTYLDSSLAALIGTISLFLYWMVGVNALLTAEPTSLLVLPVHFVLAWLTFGGVKGTFATSRLERKSDEN